MRSPFTGVRFAGLEFANFRAGKMIKLAIIAISLIPLIYGGLFLLAFLDPYGSLVNVPAAVVNQDQGAKIDGDQRNIGQELCDQLVENNEDRKEGQASGYKWQFVDEQTATEGLEDATYYMELIIPEDFSKNIASADSKNPERAQLQVYFNPSTNLIAQTVGSSMVTKIKLELTNKIEKEYFKNIFVKIDDASDQLKDAVDGSDQLSEGLGKLENGSSTLTNGLKTAESGSESLSSGLSKLESGSSTLTSGLETAESGSKKIEKGAKSAKSGSKKITSNLGTLKDGAEKVDSGVGTLSTSLKKLKSGIASAQSSTAGLASVITGVGDALTAYQKTGDTSYLTTATELAEKAKKANSTIGDDLYTYVVNLTGKLETYQTATANADSAKSDMTDASQTVAEKQAALEKSAKQLESDLGTLATAGTNTQTQLSELSESLKQLSAAAQAGQISYQEAFGKVVSALGKLDASTLSGAITAVVKSQTEGSGVETLGNLESFKTALETYQKKANAYQKAATAQATAAADASEAKGQVTGYLMGVKNASAVASSSTSTVSSAIDQLYAAVSGSLKTGTSQLASGAGKLESGSSTLTSGLGTLESGTHSLVLGLDSATDGSQKITTNLGTAKDGADKLSDGLTSATSGSQKITTNLGTAKDGADELSDGLSDGQQQLADNVQNKSEKASMMSKPVTANGESGTGENITEVKNYGTGFAPYFIGLGMWVGALMVSFLIRALNNRILMSGASSVSATLASYIPMGVICTLQAVLLLLFVQFGLGMDLKYPAAFYFFGVVVAWCFAAIIQFFRASLGTVGMVVIVVLLMLQLCTAAGTFPIEAELPFFNWLNPYLPMTYVVKGFRMAMAGLSLDYFWPACAAVLAFGVAFFFFTVLWARHKRRVTMTQLYPPIQLAE